MTTALHEHRAALSPAVPLGEDSFAATPGYRGYAELVARWSTLVDDGARAIPLGCSVEGTPLFALELGAAGAPRASLLLAGTHAMEWIGVEVGMAVLEALAADPPADHRVWAVPLLNVDGYRAVEADLRAGRRRYRRANAQRVDLNRNWPAYHRRLHLPGTLLPWLGRAGDRPREAPEVDAVCAWLDREAAAGVRLGRAVSLHSFGRVILYPYGGRWRAPDDVAAHRDATAAIRAGSPLRYRPRQTSHWLPGAFAHGTEIDHLHDAYGATALLVECSRGGFSPWRAGSWLHPFRWYNPPDPAAEAAALRTPLVQFLLGA